MLSYIGGKSRIAPQLIIPNIPTDIENFVEVKNILQSKYKNEFAVLILEEMSFKTQLRYFARCSILIGIMGSGLLNAIFMPCKGMVITNTTDSYLSRVCELRKHQLVTCTSHSFKYRGKTTWRVDTEQLIELVGSLHCCYDVATTID